MKNLLLLVSASLIISFGSLAFSQNAKTPRAGKGAAQKKQFSYGSTEVDPTITTRLSAQEQLKHFIVPKDFAIELVAADPVVINPITMVLDDKGRIIVSESHTYRYGPKGSPIKPFANPVVRLDPDGKGGFKRTLIADGFDDPVMGIAIKGNRLWLTANNNLYTYDIDEAPEASLPRKGEEKSLAINKKAILTDKNKAGNPFGMFVLEWGPDGKLYLSVGNHNINIHNLHGESISSRGNSGIVMRMNPDGSKMERLVHGLRVPYSFEFDPFGQLWLLSNGEGNPDRFIRVIDGVDYHCFSRPGVGNDWLAGNSPLAPPCEEVHGGAHTQLMRYYAAAYPNEYQGNLFCCNWGRHGFAGANRGIFRFALDERNNVVKMETLVACADPHFRPSHIHLDVDGSLLIADWYGRDDESDMTGRIWRLKYIGKDRPVVKHKLDSAEWKNDDYATEALGSPDHLIRVKAMQTLMSRVGSGSAPRSLVNHARDAKEPIGAANALWLLQNAPPLILVEGLGHDDWRVRRLALSLLARCPKLAAVDVQNALKLLPHLENPTVRVEAAVLAAKFGNGVKLLIEAIRNGAASDAYCRYLAAWHLAKYADENTITSLLASDDADVRLAGLIAIDVACYENLPSKKAALAALGKALENPGQLDQQLLLTVAQLDGDASMAPALVKLIARDDLSTATIAKAVIVLKAKTRGQDAALAEQVSAAAGKRLIEAVENGSLPIKSNEDQLVLFEFLDAEGPTPFALKQISGQLQVKDPALKHAAHSLARRFGTKASPLADRLWPNVFQPKTKFEDTLEYLATIARIEKSPKWDNWKRGLFHDDPLIRIETVRWWRNFKNDSDLTTRLSHNWEFLIGKDKTIREELAMVYRHYGETDKQLAEHGWPIPSQDKDALTKYALKELAALKGVAHVKRAAMGRQVFERNACTKCHTTATQTTPLAPSLKGIAQQKVDYLIESVLFPSKIIKTGFESEVITLTSGKVLNGLVKEDGKFLRVLSLDKEERIAKSDVESRALSRVSIMPEGQEATMSRREFVDLIAYLATLR